MKNCSVKRYNAEVNDNDLSFFGKVKVTVQSTESWSRDSNCAAFGAGCTIETLDGSAMLKLNNAGDAASKITLVNDADKVVFLNGDYIALVDKETCSKFESHPWGGGATAINYELNIGEFEYANHGNGITKLQVEGGAATHIGGDLSNIVGNIDSALFVISELTYGDISALAANTKKATVTTVALRKTQCEGNVVALGGYVAATVINLRDSLKLTGTLESICDAMKSSRNDTMTFTGNGIVTYNGTAIANGTSKTVRFGTSMVNPTEADTARGYQVA